MLRVNVQRKSTSRMQGHLSGSTAKTQSVKSRANQIPTVVRQPWDQNSWPSMPPEYLSCPLEGALPDPSSFPPCRANRRRPCALSSGSSACGNPDKTRSRWPSPLLPATPQASAAALLWPLKTQTTERRLAKFPPWARQLADQNSWPDTEPVYQTCPA